MSATQQTPSDHAVTICDAVVEFTCVATPGSNCRLICAHECVDNHAVDCDRSTKDSGRCGALIDLQAVEPNDTYIGHVQREDWRSGSIEVQWSDDAEGYQWRFQAENESLVAQRTG